MKARRFSFVLGAVLFVALALAAQGFAQEVLVAREGVRGNGAAFATDGTERIDSRITYSNINDSGSILVTAIRIFAPDGTEKTSLIFPFSLPLTLLPHQSTGFDLSATGVPATSFGQAGGYYVRTEWQSDDGKGGKAIGLQSATTIFVLDAATFELKSQDVVNGVDLPRSSVQGGETEK
jgi:hypothetical protein